MNYQIKLDSFEGPLDLLLNLINNAEIDIYDIPINMITEQYMNYIYKAEELNLDIASEFLIMASTLLHIKSKMILPKEKIIIEGEEVEIDPREELVMQILAYKKFKEASSELQVYEKEELKAYYKPREDLTLYEDKQLEIELFDLNMLVRSVKNIINKYSINKTIINTHHIEKEKYTIKNCSKILLNRLESSNEVLFTDLLNTQSSRNEIITYFLSILELIKLNYIDAIQNQTYSNLIITKTNYEES